MIRLIFGCGYLGARAAQRWIASGDQVIAITRNPQRVAELESLGLSTIVANITQPETLADLPTAQTVLVAVGMDRSKYSDIRQVYVEGLQNVLDQLSDQTEQLIYISSTGVYGDFGGDWVTEEAPTEPVRDGGKACLEAERLIAASRFSKRATILRFAGIYGPGRVPTGALIVSKQWKKLSAKGYLNLIHVNDGARIIELISNQKPAGETYLVSDGNPPLRREYYDHVAKLFGVTEIPWEAAEILPESSRSGSNKRIANNKLLERFKIELEHPNFVSGLKQALDVD